MAKHHLLPLLPLSILLFISLRATPASAVLGGWTPIQDPAADPHLKELGGFVVTEHNRAANERLEFVRVVKGDQQVVNGMNYRLLLEVKDGNGKAVRYLAVVWERAGRSGSKQLTSFSRA